MDIGNENYIGDFHELLKNYQAEYPIPTNLPNKTVMKLLKKFRC